ncbi:MAG: hypothetical protein HZB61_13110 [Nitrospirae bacterium]|nr:hypothetical protein [Nitrospirota bacterium]
MAVKHIDIKGYCDTLYKELSDIKSRLGGLVNEIEYMEGKDKKVLSSHMRHLNELIESVEWKMEIFSKSCPIDWSKFGVESETTSSVPLTDSDVPGGYAGG